MLLYNFFDYKYNIPNYGGEDFDNLRYIFTIICLLTIPLVFIFLRKAKHQHVDIFLKVISILMIVLEITKVSWESYWDIKTGRGFNAGGILPFETCSLFMYTLLFAAWGKGGAKNCALAWISTIGFVGGMANAFFLNALKWYPILTFGAFHSMIFHWMMIFTAMLLIASGYKKFEWKDIFYAFIPHLIFSTFVITIDYAMKWDYMLYRDAGGVPFVEDVADKLNAQNLQFVTTLIMLGIYAFIPVVFTSIYIGVPAMIHSTKKTLTNEETA